MVLCYIYFSTHWPVTHTMMDISVYKHYGRPHNNGYLILENERLQRHFIINYWREISVTGVVSIT